MRAIFLAAVAAGVAAAGAVDAANLRIAAVTSAPGVCHVLGAGAPAEQKAYYKHLASRLGRDILECPVATEAAAAQALTAGAVDMAVLDPAGFAPVGTQTRAILTVRPAGGLNRIPVLLVTKASSTRASLAALRGETVVYGGQTPAALAVPRQALADQGAVPGYFAREEVAADPDAAVAKLRSGDADAMVVNAAAWERLCRGDRPQEQRCGDLKVLWRGRPRAVRALVVRRDMPDELRFRLIGIHVAMHIEAKDAFVWGASWIPDGAEFEPAEADALALAAR
jgi:ABC-type phosphate/phosphonate transport system substrate-binding protein